MKIKIKENTTYIHGYSNKESLRLNLQANILEDIIHDDSIFPKNSLVLEAGCGVGAQTKIIASRNPDSNFISVDLSEESIKEARRMVQSENISNVEIQQANIYNLPFKDETFDSAIVCFVLEHLNNPFQALTELKRVIKKGGTLIAIEGDHGSALFHPASKYAQYAINCQIQLQKLNGGDTNIGRKLFPLFRSIKLVDISVCPKIVYIDASKPNLVEGFIKNTFTAMIEGVRKNAILEGFTDKHTFDKGINDLHRTAESDGVFSYTFFKGVGIKK